jgi:small-conductance mechanosensitive channel
LENAGDQLRSLGVASLQFVIAMLAAILIAKWVRKTIRRRTRNSPSQTAAVMAENMASASVYVIAFTILLTFWGLTWSGLITALSISTVAVAFGFQDLLRSFVGGLLAVVERPFSLGDRIKIRDLEGKVERIELRTTVIRGDNGDRITVPNALILSDPVINRSPNRISRVISISGIDGVPAEVRHRAHEALADLSGLDGLPKVSVKTKQNLQRMRRAVDAVPGIEL